MKPTGATKEATGHSPLPWRVIIDDTGDPETGGYPAIVGPERFDEMIVHWKGFHHQYWDHHPNKPTQVANAQLIVTAVNGRERLREALHLALKIVADRAAGGRMLTTHKEAKEVWDLGAAALGEELSILDISLNDQSED